MSRLLRSWGLVLVLLATILPTTTSPALAAGSRFPDVSPEASYAEAVQQLVASGIIRGYPDGRFGPNDSILRAQSAVTLVRAMRLAGQRPSHNFSDQGSTDDESWNAVRILADQAVARGYADGTFQPAGVLTRQQAVSFISRTMVAVGGWSIQNTSTISYADVAVDHAADVATYSTYVGVMPQTTAGNTMNATAVASRGWYAETLWAALASAQSRPGPAPLSSSPASTPTTSPVQAPAVPPTTVPSPTPAPTVTPSYTFGTLLSDDKNATQLYAAGVRVVHLELGWDAYEPREGAFNAAYATAAAQKLKVFRDAGLQVVLGVGLQYPPAWIYTYPNSRYVDQVGHTAGAVNLTFNQALRQRAAAYIARVHQDLGLNNFVAVRIGSGGLIEAMYPSENEGGGTNSYWAFDVNAQGGTGRPASIAANPYPGWQPGQTSYQGQPFTVAQVQIWYDWYLGAMVDGINWQLGVYQQLGYTGDRQVLLPGLGSRPDEYGSAIAHYLNGTGDTMQTMGRAAVWNKVIAGLTNRQKVVIYISSLADGSGGNNVCSSADMAVREDDPQVDTWSAARWISYNANRYGLQKNGENPGSVDTKAYGLSMLQAAVLQMRACGLQGMMWAHEANLYDNTSGITVADYAAAISAGSK